MDTELQSLEEINRRLLKLENQNRRLKQIGAAVLIAAGSLAVMGQSSQTNANGSPRKTFEANEFVLRDWGGNIRAKLSMDDVENTPRLAFLDAKGKVSLELVGNMPNPGAPDTFRGSVLIDNEQGQSVGAFFGDDEGAVLRVSKAKGPAGVFMLPGDVDIIDENGFRASVGKVELVTPKTGATQQTSAASVALFDNKKNLIWKAP